MPGSLHQLDDADYQQNHRPGASPSRYTPPAVVQVVQQRKPSHRDQNRRARKTALTIIAAVVTGFSLCRQPQTEANQKHGPEGVDLEEPNVQVMQQKQYAESDQNHGAGRDPSGKIGPLSDAEHRPQSKGIWRRLTCLERLRRFNSIDELVDDKGCDPDTEGSSHGVAMGTIYSDDQKNEDDQVSQSLRVLTAVNRAHSERKKSRQNSRQCRIRPGVCGMHWRRISGRGWA